MIKVSDITKVYQMGAVQGLSEDARAGLRAREIGNRMRRMNSPADIMADEPTGNLESESGADILQVLQDLHRSGLTVIMVTHDPEVAAAAERIITMKDGQVLSDTKDVGGAAESQSGIVESRRDGSSSSRRKPFREFVALLAQASRSLSANKVRTALSMLGVLIGVAAVISVMALGAGAKVAVEAQVSAMGANLLVVQPPRPKSRGGSLGAGIVSRLSVSDAGTIRDSIEGVQNACGSVNGSVQITFDGNNCSTEARGVELPDETIHSMTPQAGRFFSEEEGEARV